MARGFTSMKTLQPSAIASSAACWNFTGWRTLRHQYSGVRASPVIAVPVAKLTTEAEQMRARMIAERDRWAAERSALVLPKIDSVRGVERELLQPARAALARMQARGQGRIVQCSSILGLLPYRYRGAYTASKYALEGLTVTLRMELEGSGIHVSLIEPGPIESRFTANALRMIEANVDLKNSAHAREYERQLARLDGTGPVNRYKLGPDAVYKVLKHALTAPRPRPHYPVTVPARRGMLLKRLLPADLFYRLMRMLD